MLAYHCHARGITNTDGLASSLFIVRSVICERLLLSGATVNTAVCRDKKLFGARGFRCFIQSAQRIENIDI